MRCDKVVLACALCASGAAFAGVPNLGGGWSGEAISILPDGSLVTSEITLCIENQEGGLFSGSATSRNVYAGDGLAPVQPVCVTGHIATDKRVRAAFTPPPGHATVPLMALVEGKRTGKGISAVARDPSDGSTSEIRLSPDSTVACPLLIPDSVPFVSEIHYDNTGTDTGEAIEVSVPDGVSLDGYSLILYNGANGSSYNSIDLTGEIPSNGVVVIDLPTNGLQNGAPDGLALVDDNGSVIEFLSYEGVFAAADGAAAGLTSSDIGVAESSSTAVGDSLQLIGSAWTGPQLNTFGNLNEDDPFGLTTFSCSATE